MKYKMKYLTEGITHNPTSRAHMIDVGALVELLISKKLITLEEYQEMQAKVCVDADAITEEKKALIKTNAIAASGSQQ